MSHKQLAVAEFAFQWTLVKKLIAALAIARAKKVGIFGASTLSHLVVKTLKKYRINVTLIADNNSKLHGSMIEDTPVASPAELVNEQVDYIIIVSDQGYDSISKQLKGKGYNEYYDFISYRLVMAHTFY